MLLFLAVLALCVFLAIFFQRDVLPGEWQFKHRSLGVRFLMEQKRLAAEESRGLCVCGKALGRRAAMCYDCYIDQYRVYMESDGTGPLPEKARPNACPSCTENPCRCGEELVEIEDNWTAKDQEEYDLANDLCLNCHQSPCSFDCCYDETEEDLNGFPSWWVIKAYGTDCARCDQHVGYCDCESGPYPPSCGPSSFED